MAVNAPENILANRPLTFLIHDLIAPVKTNFGCFNWGRWSDALSGSSRRARTVQQKTFAIIAFMIIYWLAEPIDHGLTALIGCYLFWALNVVKFSVAFSGFVNATVWFLFG